MVFKEFVHVCIVKVAPIHQSHVHGLIKIWLTIFEKGHSKNISVIWGLAATDCCAYRLDLATELAVYSGRDIQFVVHYQSLYGLHYTKF